MKVAAFNPGAIAGTKLCKYCRCRCHTDSAIRHFRACCVNPRGFDDFPALDENGTPTAKLPPCPLCDEDELGVINPDTVLCYKCGWKMIRFPQPEGAT
jgi:hypothetical protein